jgi:multidrug efflux pump subunit AcrA (membrane-fusion protein)
MTIALPRVLLASAVLLVTTGCTGSFGDSPDEATSDGDSASHGEEAGEGSEAAAAANGDGADTSRSVAGGRDAARETLVVVRPLQVGPIRDEVVVSSKVETRTEVTVFPKLANLPVTAVLVDEGDHVKAGDVLMQLYDTELRLAEQTAKGRLDETAKEVERAAHKVVEADHRISRAERQAEKMQADLERFEGLIDDGLVNVQEVADLRLAAETSQDDLQLESYARDDLALAHELTSIRASQAQIEWERSKSDLAHATVVSPTDGVVALRDVDVGELSTTSTAAFRVVDLSEPLLNLRVPQDALNRLAKGQRVEVTAVTNPDVLFIGRVRTVNPVLDQATGTVRVIVDLEFVPGLVPGLFCEARIVTAARDEAFLVDKRAVLYEDDQPVFYALSEGGETVHKVPFQAGASTPDSIEVIARADGSGLASDLQVVVVGQESLKDGARVKVRETAY